MGSGEYGTFHLGGKRLAAPPAGDVHETKRGFDPTLMIDLSATEV